MKSIKCNFKNINREDKAKFKDSCCLVLISVGQEAHEKERFATTLDLVNSSFKSCKISLYDTLQRHTMAINSPHEADFFHSTAKKEGDLWLERNEEYIGKLSIPNKIFRWDTWLNHIDYLKQKSELITLLEDDPTYKSVFDMAINKYLERYCRNLVDKSKFDMNRAKKICLDYILEECVVLCLWPELGCQYELYPNIHNEAIIETRRRFIEIKNQNLLSPLTIRFRNAKQLKPQRFTSLEDDMVSFASEA